MWFSWRFCEENVSLQYSMHSIRNACGLTNQHHTINPPTSHHRGQSVPYGGHAGSCPSLLKSSSSISIAWKTPKAVTGIFTSVISNYTYGKADPELRAGEWLKAGRQTNWSLHHGSRPLFLVHSLRVLGRLSHPGSKKNPSSTVNKSLLHDSELGSALSPQQQTVPLCPEDTA